MIKRRPAIDDLFMWVVSNTLGSMMLLGVSIIPISLARTDGHVVAAVLGAGVLGWIIGLVQAVLADTMLGVRLVGWPRTHLAGGVILGFAAIVLHRVTSAMAVSSGFVTEVLLLTALVVITLLQGMALERLSSRAWLWALGAPVLAWVMVQWVTFVAFVMNNTNMPFQVCGALLLGCAVYHTISGLALRATSLRPLGKPRKLPQESAWGGSL